MAATMSMCFRRATLNKKSSSKAKNVIMALLLITMLMTPSDDMFGSSTGFNQVRAEENRDFYKILGIPRSAKEKEIKKAFKKMSMKYHPDKNKGDEGAMKKYQDITAAYDALSDAERRRKYDQYGEEGLNKPDRGGGGDPFDFFGDFFGGGG